MTEQEIKTKRLEILEDTVKYYSEDTTRRCYDERGCCRYNHNGRKCAIGRLTKNKITEGSAIINKNLQFSELEKELQMLGWRFISDLQWLHDNEDFWDIKGITESGNILVNSIKKSFCV